METYINKEIVHDAKTAKEYAQTLLEHSFYYNDAAFFIKLGNYVNQEQPGKDR
jgi:urease accessory protein